MVPKNLMESAVREAVVARRDASADAASMCWCPLCLADIQALALSGLPPQYATRAQSRSGRVGMRDAAVRAEVARAIQQVASRPKHNGAKAGAPGDPVALVNFPFEIGFTMIEERMHRSAGSCECFDCRCDAVAFALNRFPPKYGVAVGGRSAFPESSRQQLAEEMAPFLDLGVSVVATHPRHPAL